MRAEAKPCAADEVLPLRARHREEMNCQIVHDSIHRREGWAKTYRLELDGVGAGFGSVAIAGPWKDKPTVFELFVVPQQRSHAFVLFEAMVEASGAGWYEVQTNDELVTATVLGYAADIASEKLVFRDGRPTVLRVQGATVRAVTPAEEIRLAMERRQGGGEWLLELDGTAAGKGGILFHYNLPYGDIYMEVAESFRRRGLGSFLVQELKRNCYELGAIPCARCNTANVASRRTILRAGFVPCAHILYGALSLKPRSPVPS